MSKAVKFSDRTRFNWGYHDAALTVKEEWDNDAHHFGFCRGAFGGITCPADVLAKHPDKAYAQGWSAGYEDARDGTYEALGCSSDQAWKTAIKLRLVTAK